MICPQTDEMRQGDTSSTLSRTSHKHYISRWVLKLEHGFFNGKEYSPESIKTYKYYVEEYFRHYSRVRVENVEEMIIQTEKSKSGRRVKIRNSMICYARFLASEGLLDEKVLDKLKALRLKRTKPVRHQQSFTKEEVNLLLNKTSRLSDRVVIILLHNTAMRISEVCNLEWRDVNFERQTIYIRDAKGGKSRTIGMNHKVYEALKEIEGIDSKLVLGGLNRHTCYKRIMRLGDSLGIKAYPHKFRSTTLTRWLMSGKPMPVVQAAAGHSNISVTERYFRPTEDEMIEMMSTWT